MSTRRSRIDRLREAKAATPPAVAITEVAPPVSKPTAPVAPNPNSMLSLSMLRLSVVPLARLRMSDLNVRKTHIDEDIKGLDDRSAAS